MAAVKSLDKEINHYLEHLDNHQKEVVLSVGKTFAQEYDVWENESFVREMNSRIEELESGKDKGTSWETVKQKARQSAKNRKTMPALLYRNDHRGIETRVLKVDYLLTHSY